jgi:hypothetical protein
MELFEITKSFSFLVSSIVFPAVFNSELGINIVKLLWILMAGIIESHFGPFGSMLNQWEVETPLSWMLKGLSNSIVMPVNMLVVPVFIGFLCVVF